MKALSIVALVVYSFGIYAFGVLSWYQLRGSARGECYVGTPRSTHSRVSDRLGTAIILVSLVWFVVMLLLSLEIQTWRNSVHGLQLLLLFSFPPLVMHLGYAEALDRNPARVPRALRFVHRIAWPLSQFISFGVVLSFFEVIAVVPSRWLDPILGISISLLFGATAVHGVVLLTRTKERVESPRERSARRWMGGLFLLLLVLVVPNFTGDFGRVFQLLGTSMPLMFMFVGVYHESRFEFFDLFIKRGLSLLITIVLLTAFFGLAFPWLERLELGWIRPWIYTIVLSPLVMVMPWLHRKLSGLLDSVVLGRRFTTVEAVKHVLAGLQSATDERELVQQAEQGLGIMHMQCMSMCPSFYCFECVPFDYAQRGVMLPVPGHNKVVRDACDI